jgi:hypothetical protein
MNKKRIILVIIVGFLIYSSLSSGVINKCNFNNKSRNGEFFPLLERKNAISAGEMGYIIRYFNTDKDVYYSNETIHINGSWYKFEDDPEYDISFFQFQILNCSNNNILWESEEYHENAFIGDPPINKSVEVSIEDDLALDINCSTSLKASLFYHGQGEYYTENKSILVLEEGNFSLLEWNINGNIFYLEESINVNLTYNLLYNFEYETSYVEIRVFNSTQHRIWNSSRFNQIGENITKSLNITVKELGINCNESITINVKLFYYYNSSIRPLEKHAYYCNETVEIIEKGNFTPIELNLNKNVFYPDETIEIFAAWQMSYNLEYETSIVQIRIYNLSNTLIWKSSKYNESKDNLILNLKISQLNTSKKETSCYISLYHYYNSSIGPLEKHAYYCNETVEIIEKGNFTPIELNLNKNVFYPDETIEIFAAWQMSYNLEYETSIVQIRIYNLSNTLIWKSSKYNESKDNLILNLKISQLNTSKKETSCYISLYHYYNSSIINLQNITFQLNNSFIIKQKENKYVPYFDNLISTSRKGLIYENNIIIILVSAIPFTFIGLIIFFTKKRKNVEEITIEY